MRLLRPHPRYASLPFLAIMMTVAAATGAMASRFIERLQIDLTGEHLALMGAIASVPMVVALLWVSSRLRKEREQDHEEGTGDRAADSTLRETLERIRLILDSTLDAVVGMDVQGNITDWNARAEAMFGWTQKEIVGRKLVETIIPPQYRDAHERGFQRFLASGEGPFLNRCVEITALRRDGTEFPIELTISPLKIGESYVFSSFIADISERKRTEETLRDSQERFRKAFNEASIGMALVATDGRFLQVNRALCQIVGHVEHELLATNFQSITHPDDLQADLALVQQLLNGEIPNYQMEKRYIHKLGHVVWVQLTVSIVRDMNGTPLYFIAQIQDITERKRTEAVLEESRKQLHESEARYKNLFEYNPLMYFTLAADGTVASVNPQGAAQLGYTVAELTDQPVTIVFPTDLQAAVRNQLDLCLGEPDHVHTWEITKVRKDGSLLWVRETAVSIRDQHQHQLILIMCEDITERKQTEEALRSNEQMLRTLLEEREQLMQNLHDGIIQSLYTIGMSIDECRRLTDEDPRKAGMKLGQTVGDINRVIREVRHHLVEGADDLPFSAHNLKSELARIAGAMERASVLHFRLKVDSMAAECLTTEERKEILYIAQETMSNCLRHSSASVACVSLRLERDCVYLEVEDDGKGFDTTTLLETHGGLRNIARRAEKVGARVEIVSRREHGTRIRLSVPIHN